MNAPAFYRIDSTGPQLLTAAQYTALACDPQRSVVVRACAGAGKTWLLTARLARLLLAGAEPQDILAITFTRKAAAEMRDRLQALLREWAGLDDASLRDALQQRGLASPDAETLARARGLYPRLLAGGRLPAVQTFHSWFAQVLRSAPLAFGVPPGFELLQDERALREQALDDFYRSVHAEGDLREDFAALVQRVGRKTAQDLLDAVFARRGEFALARKAGVVAQALPLDEPQSWLAFVAAHRPRLQTWCAGLAQGKVEAQKASDRVQRALDATDDAAAEQALAEWCFAQSGNPRSPTRLLTGGAPQALHHAGIDDPESAWMDWCETVDAQRRDWNDHAAAIDNLRALRLAQVWIEHYEKRKAERGALDFDDLEQRAFDLLQNSDHAAQVQELLDLRWRHLLIDEFQDTNPVQWHALYAWLSAYAGDASQPTVFIVGDDKQSIYRFRRADPQVFDAAASFLRQGFAAVQLSAQHTRRLSAAVCEAVNAVFPAAVPDGMQWVAHSQDNPAPGLVALLPRTEHVQAAADAAATRVMRDTLRQPYRTAEASKVDRDAATVAAALRELIGRFPVQDGQAQRAARAGDVLLLLRKRQGRMAQYLQALQDAGIAAIGSDADASLLDTLEAADLIALLRFLLSPEDDLALAHALKSPIGGVDDATLTRISQVADPQRRLTWWQVCQRWGGDSAGDAAVVLFAKFAQGWMQALATLPVHDALDRIVAEGDLRARFVAAAPAALAATVVSRLDALLTLALEFDGGRFVTPRRWLLALQRRLQQAPLPALADTADAVRVSTIHGAKGLEAPIVVLADADNSGNGRGPQVLLDWPVEQPSPRHFSLLIDPKRPHRQQQTLVAAEQAAQTREDWNLLYVAMTRARQALLVSRIEPGNTPSAPTWGARLEQAGLPGDLGVELSKLAGAGGGAAGQPQPTPALPADLAWTPAPPAATEQASRAERLGVAVHQLLQQAESGALPAPLTELPAAALAGWLGVDAGAAAQAREVAQAVLASPAVARFFDPQQVRWARNEVDVALPAREGQPRSLGRIDRLVELDDALWVLDYKLATAAGLDTDRYADTLRRYGEAVSAWRPGKAVRLALISGDGRLIEVPMQAGVAVATTTG